MKEKLGVDDLPTPLQGCKHETVVVSKDFCPHKGYSTEYHCKDCGTVLGFYAGVFFTYTTPRMKAVASTVEEV